MNERIVSEITLMSEEAEEIMLRTFEKQVETWCNENKLIVQKKDTEIKEIISKIQRTLTSHILLINLK